MFLVDRYEILNKVGAGGMSDVYKAKDHILGRIVAIKVLKQEFSEDINFVTKFRTEAQSAAALEHPNIVNIYDVGSENGMHFIVMEFVEGITLKTYIEKKGQLYHCRHILLRPTFVVDEIMAPMRDLDSLVNLIKKDSLSFEEAARKHSDDKHSKQNGGVVTNHDLLERYSAYDAKLTATKFLKEDFGAMGGKSIDDYNAIRRLKEGEVSAPFRSSDMMGNELVKVVKLLKVIPAHNASLDQDYLRLEQMALSAKQEKEFREWLDKKIASMYIYIAPEFRNGDFSNKNWVKYSK